MCPNFAVNAGLGFVLFVVRSFVVLQVIWRRFAVLGSAAQSIESLLGFFKQQTQKAIATRKEKYGTASCQIFERKQICKFCGKEFVTTNTRQIYCDGPHLGPCPICGKPSKIPDLTTGVAVACSEECRLEEIRRTTRERYGVDCYFQSDEFKSQSKETCLEKYDAEFYSQSDEGKQVLSERIKAKYTVFRLFVRVRISY